MTEQKPRELQMYMEYWQLLNADGEVVRVESVRVPPIKDKDILLQVVDYQTYLRAGEEMLNMKAELDQAQARIENLKAELVHTKAEASERFKYKALYEDYAEEVEELQCERQKLETKLTRAQEQIKELEEQKIEVARSAVKLIEKKEELLDVARKYLEKIEDVNSALKDNPDRSRGHSYGDWELRRIAREALAKIGKPNE